MTTVSELLTARCKGCSQVLILDLQAYAEDITCPRCKWRGPAVHLLDVDLPLHPVRTPALPHSIAQDNQKVFQQPAAPPPAIEPPPHYIREVEARGAGQPTPAPPPAHEVQTHYVREVEAHVAPQPTPAPPPAHEVQPHFAQPAHGGPSVQKTHSFEAEDNEELPPFMRASFSSQRLQQLGGQLLRLLLKIDRSIRPWLNHATFAVALAVAFFNFFGDQKMNLVLILLTDLLLLLLWMRFVVWLALLAEEDGSWHPRLVYQELRGRMAAKFDEMKHILELDTISKLEWAARMSGWVAFFCILTSTICRLAGFSLHLTSFTEYGDSLASFAWFPILFTAVFWLLALYIARQQKEVFIESAQLDSQQLPAYIDLTSQQAPALSNPHLATVFEILEKQRRHQRDYEHQHQGALMRSLRRNLKEVRAQAEVPLGEGRVDIALPGLLYLELKQNPKKTEADRMITQVSRYSKNAGDVPVWLLLFQSAPPTDELLQELQDLHQRAKVVTVRVS